MELVRRDPHPALRPYVRQICGFEEVAPVPVVRRELPFAGTVLIVLLDTPLWIAPEGGRELRFGSFFGGLHDVAVRTRHTGRLRGVETYLTPLGAHRLLGLPMDDLANRIVALEDLLGAELEARIAAAHGSPARMGVLERALLRRLEQGRAPSPDVAWAWRRLTETHGGVAVGALAAELGCSRRHLAVRFREQVGLPPKAVARLLRFERAVALLDTGAAAADVAYTCGYADQPHFNREFRALAGITPTVHRAERAGLLAA